MNSRMWVNEKVEEIELAQKRALEILRHEELAHAHEIVVSTLADMLIAKAFLKSSLTLLDAKEE